MTYNTEEAIRILERTPSVLQAMLGGLNDNWTQASEGEGTWTPHEIIGHLIHGEKTDWIPRTRIIFDSHSEVELVPFDMEAHLNDGDDLSMDQLLSEFEMLRIQNIKALREFDLNEENLERIAIHPSFGKVTLKQHLAAWLVHDLGHIAQISRVLAKQYRAEVGPWVDFMAILNDRMIPSNNT